MSFGGPSLASTLGAAPHPPAAPPTAPAAAPPDLASQALTLAQQYTDPIIAAYKATRDSDLADARKQAGAITAASQGGASLLGDLPALVKNDYAGAVNTEQKSAAGFSQGLAALVHGQATRDANALAQTGSPLQAPDHSASLADLLYGLGGKLPGDALTTQGLGAVAAARALPASLLSSGIVQSEGALGAGQSQADRVDAQIAATEGGVPGMASRLALQLQQMNRPALVTRSDGSVVALDPNTGQVLRQSEPPLPVKPELVNRRDGSAWWVDPSGKVLSQAFGATPVPPQLVTKSDGSQVWVDATTQKIVGTFSGPPPPSAPKTVSLGGYLYAWDAAKGTYVNVGGPGAKAAGKITPSSITSRTTGVLSYVGADGHVYAVTGANGKPIPYNGQSASSDRLIANQLKGMAKGDAKYLHDPTDPNAGKNGAPTGYVLLPGTGVASYQDMLSYATNAYGGDQAKALRSVNRITTPGENGRPYETVKQALPNIKQNVSASIAYGHPASDVYAQLLATGVYPPNLQQALVYWINKLYTQDYYRKNPKATSTPAGQLIAG